MYKFGSKSLGKLATVREDLRGVAHAVMDLQVYDFTIITGFRNQVTQDRAYRMRNSKVEWPNSQHNRFDAEGRPSSNAIDIAPWYCLASGKMGVPWLDVQSFVLISGMFIAIGATLGVHLRYGGDWDMDGNTQEHDFNDWGHIEVANRGQ